MTEPDGQTIKIAVIGAGPCGIAVGAAAVKAETTCRLFDRGAITQSLLDYPSYMTFFSTAEKLEVGGIPFAVAGSKPTRREALVYYRKLTHHFSLDIHQYEDVAEISGSKGHFDLKTKRRDGSERRYSAASIVVATGGFHAPNLLDVPGEELPNVSHYYREPYRYFGEKVLVVGGGNSAVETALDLHWNGVRVDMVHFGDVFDRGVKPWLLPDIQNRIDAGEIIMHWRSRVSKIAANSVTIQKSKTPRDDEFEEIQIENDWVLAMTGWSPDHAFLKRLGVGVNATSGVPDHDPGTMETNVPGVYIAGVIAAGKDANRIFIENGKLHGELIVEHLSRE